jgi:Zn-dependent M28 family amino/carboxypeptidase
VLVGAHFDSWDEGQGAIDNGIGIAQLYALARLLRDVELERTVELVWFNGEEQGLWGSRYAAESGRDATNPPAVVLNLDMVGVPIGANAMGHDELIPILDRWNEARGENALENETANKSWLASDHTPYQLAGVRAVTFNAPIPPDSVRYYHDFADTFDKLTPEIIKNSSAIIASLVVELATIDDLPTGRLSQAEVEELFTKAKLKARLQASGMWPFADEEAAAE